MLDSLSDKLSKMRMYEKVYNERPNTVKVMTSYPGDTLVVLQKETKIKSINKSSVMIDDIFNDIKNMKKLINKK